MIKKIVLLIVLFFGSIFTSYAHDETLVYDFSSLGNISALPLPYNLFDFTITEESDVTIVYNGYNCILDDDFFIYIDGIGFNIPCHGGNSGIEHLEMDVIHLLPGTYEVYTDENRLLPYEIREFYVYVDITDGFVTGTGTFYDMEYKQIGFFDSYLEFIDFAEQTTIAYLIGLFCVLIFFGSIFLKNQIV